MKPSPLTVCVAALVVLAGCPATVHDGTPDGTATPAPVPTTTLQSPPGVTAAGVSGSELAATHRRALERTNYTLVIRERIVGSSGTIQRIDHTRRVRADGDAVAGQYERSIREFPLVEYVPPEVLESVTGNSVREFPFVDPNGTVEYWTDRERFGIRERAGGRVVYPDGEEAGQFIADVSGARSINRTMGALRFAVTARADGTVVLRVTGSRDIETLPTPAYVQDVHNVSGTVRVRTDGLVTDWRIAYDATLEDRPVRVVQEGHIRNPGSTTVERPNWFETSPSRSEERGSGSYAGSIHHAGPDQPKHGDSGRYGGVR